MLFDKLDNTTPPHGICWQCHKFHLLRPWLSLTYNKKCRKQEHSNSNYTGVSVSGLSRYRYPPPFHDSVKGRIVSGQFGPKGLGIRTSVLSIRTGVGIPRPLRSKSCQKQKTNTGFGRSEYGEPRNLCKISLASLEAEIKPLTVLATFQSQGSRNPD